MATVALSGSDTVVLNGRNFADLADQDCVALTFPNEIATVKIGKNGNAVFGLNEQGNMAEMVMRLVRGSADDKFMNQLLNQQNLNFAGSVLLQGTFIKKVGDGQGNITNDTYVVSSGVFFKKVDGKMNTEGDSEQSVSIYSVRFAKAARAIT